MSKPRHLTEVATAAALDGGPQRPLEHEVLAHALEARERDDRPWLWFHTGARREALSFSGAFSLARGWAAALFQAGVRAGDAVGIFQPNSPDFVGGFFGAQLLGATAVPLPWPVVPGGAPSLPMGAEAMLRVARARAVCAPPGTAAPLHVVSEASRGPFVQKPQARTTAFIQFTSGSTGRPRGAEISQRAAMSSAHGMARALGLTADDVGVSWLPFFHDMGLVGVLMSSLAAGFAVHVLRPTEVLLHPRRWLELMSSERASLTVAPNFGYELLVRRGGSCEGLTLGWLRAALSGSEPVLRGTIDAFERRFEPAGLRRGTVLPVYGLAENTLGVCFARPGELDADLHFEGRWVPAVGTPLEGTKVAVRRGDGTRALEHEEGEIIVKGPSLMDGYVGDSRATARAFDGGWLKTGDRGVVAQGQLHVTGRDKELVIKAGRKFHPADIEREVAQVVDTPPNGVAAFSVLHEEQRGEELVVVVELKRDEPFDVARKVRGHLADALGVTPDRVELVKAGMLPRTTSGKLRRGECAERFSAGAPA
ncbi:MAG: AMP-binding protein [Myxococcaceae bacterium]|nr:AMP-binding protein [Myxococcaceae bacterium]